MKTITTVYLDVNKTRDLRQYDVRQGDKDSREFHIILTENGQPITLTSGMSATADAVVRNVIVAQGEALTVDTANQYIVMTLTEEMLTLAGNMKIDVKVSESGAVLTAATLVLYVGAAVINENTHIEPGGTTIGAQIIALNTRVNAAEAEIADAAADVSALQATLAGIEATNTEISGEILSFNYQGETVRKISEKHLPEIHIRLPEQPVVDGGAGRHHHIQRHAVGRCAAAAAKSQYSRGGKRADPRHVQ